MRAGIPGSWAAELTWIKAPALPVTRVCAIAPFMGRNGFLQTDHG
jgi:hypothetical protein